ncbi:hypothetical protein FGW37_22370 [Streptomyces rectiverticillatus]|uniref:hypothetical protein n=1 Tax=Streptomyces rectiverticillatus TaxID=173860 RepID=UPI0015C3B825|nr:hypothetical protein [Streptomyces rectiverticillatus]QLE73957.1 hypothetical protein FGW37_22370 [Streptomyces rectiverticillatus]
MKSLLIQMSKRGTHMVSSGRTLSSFRVGDKVTVRAPSDRPLYHHGSHGTVVTIGTKRVHVRMDKAAFESHDGEVANFLPGDLDPGHMGTPRNSDRMNNAVTAYKLAAGTDLVAVAMDAGVITAEQGERMKAIWASHLQR